MKVTNISKAPQGVNAKSGRVFIRPGETRDVDLSETGLKQAKRLTKLLSFGKAKEPEKPAQGYAVLDKGHGWYAVMLNGTEVTKSLRADDVAGFADLSDEDKVAFADLHKAE